MKTIGALIWIFDKKEEIIRKPEQNALFSTFRGQSKLPGETGQLRTKPDYSSSRTRTPGISRTSSAMRV